MPGTEAPDVFAVDEEVHSSKTGSVGDKSPTPTANVEKSPTSFLNSLSKPTSPSLGAVSLSPPSIAPTAPTAPISPTFMLSSMTASSATTHSLLENVKERMHSIRPWQDFFAINQFHIPESSTAAQSRITHNGSHFQNNYLVIVLLLTVFSLLSNFGLLLVAGVVLGGFYYLSTLHRDFTVKVGGQDINTKQLNYIWMAVCVILLYVSSAISTVFWIFSVAAVLVGGHAVLHDIAIESEFNSV